MKLFQVTLIYSNPDKTAEIYIEAESDVYVVNKAKKIAKEQFPELCDSIFVRSLVMSTFEQRKNQVQ
jgi:hypothetical protein